MKLVFLLSSKSCAFSKSPRNLIRAFALFLVLALPSQAMAELRVVTTIAPLHSLAAGVLEGVTVPHLLIRGARSPHDFTLRPSDLTTLNDADIILRVDGTFETGLARPLSRLAPKIKIISFMAMAGVKLIPFRGGAARNMSDDAIEHTDHTDHTEHASQTSDVEPGESAGERDMHLYDPHVWLDIDNAVAFVQALAKTISAMDKNNSARILENAEKLIARLRVLDIELAAQTVAVKGKPFITYHNAYSYFEGRYQLSSRGAVTSGAHIQPGLRHLTEIRNIFKSGKAICLFTEPQFPPKLARRLISGTPGRLGVLDPLGAANQPGSDQYFMLMRALGKNLTNCLNP